MGNNKILRSILKLALLSSVAALTYVWGKDEGYNCGYDRGFKDGYKGADENAALYYESEGNAMSPSEKVTTDKFQSARLATPKDFEYGRIR